jgi:hypothetical protein
MKYKKTTFFILLSILFFVLPIIVFGQETEISWPKSPTGRELTLKSNLQNLIFYAYEWAVSIGGMIVFFILIRSGLMYLFSTGDASKMANALKGIKSAVIGLVLLLSSWLILNSINPELVQLKIGEEIGKINDLSLENLTDLEPDCDFVIFYPEKNFKGKKTIYQEKDFNKDIKPGDEDEDASRDIESWIGLTKIDCKLLKDRYDSFYDIKGKERKTTEIEDASIKECYVPGGSCYIELYGEVSTGTWFWKKEDPCAKRLLSSVSPDNDVTYSIYENEEVSCFKIIQN